MSDYCEAHWVRQAVKLPVFRVGLCAECFAGKPIRREETIEIGTEALPDLPAPRRDGSRRYRYSNCTLRRPLEGTEGPYRNVGHALKFCRFALDVTQREMALRMAVPRTWISKAENSVCEPTIGLLEKAAAALGLPTWFFVALCETRLYEQT